jgi:flagellar basal body-associated protein FliL
MNIKQFIKQKKIIIIIIILIFMIVSFSISLALVLKNSNSNKNNNSNQNQALINQTTNNPTTINWNTTMCQQYLDECKNNINKGLISSSALNGCYQILESHGCGDMSKN